MTAVDETITITGRDGDTLAVPRVFRTRSVFSQLAGQGLLSPILPVTLTDLERRRAAAVEAEEQVAKAQSALMEAERMFRTARDANERTTLALAWAERRYADAKVALLENVGTGDDADPEWG